MSPTALALWLSLAPALAEDEPDGDVVEPIPAPQVEPAAPVEPPPQVEPEAPLQPIGMALDFLPGVGASRVSKGGDVRNLSLGLVGTYAGAIDGMELTSVIGLVRRDVDGIQLSGGGNIVGGELDGFQGAGGANIVAGGVDGFQTAGGLNIAVGGVDGFQVAGGLNIAEGGVDGMQIAGGMNIAGGEVDGPQLAGGINIATGVDGVQIAPINISSDDVRGLQLGVVNIARDSDVSLGLINVIYEGRTHVDITQSSTGFVEASLKHGGRKFHYIYGAGIRPQGPCPEWAMTVGAGGHFELSNSLFIDADLLARHVSPASGFLAATNTLATARAVAGLQVFDEIAITGGLTANTLVSSVQGGEKYVRNDSVVGKGGSVTTRTFPGVQIGVQLF